MINFIRGVDSYNEVTVTDEKKDKLVSGERWKLGDIYHSELKVIGAPAAKVSDDNVNAEAYYRFNRRSSIVGGVDVENKWHLIEFPKYQP